MTDLVSERALRPGLAKARALPLLERRDATLVRATDGRWRALLERASILSEGAPRGEGADRTWYGSTSLVVPLGELTAAEQHLVARVAAFDLHLRLRALRIARQEAALRAPCPLGTSTCAVRISWESAGLRIDVDVEAPMMVARARASARRSRREPSPT